MGKSRVVKIAGQIGYALNSTKFNSTIITSLNSMLTEEAISFQNFCIPYVITYLLRLIMYVSYHTLRNYVREYCYRPMKQP